MTIVSARMSPAETVAMEGPLVEAAEVCALAFDWAPECTTVTGFSLVSANVASLPTAPDGGIQPMAATATRISSKEVRLRDFISITMVRLCRRRVG